MSTDRFPTAKAVIKGYGEHQALQGKVLFYPVNNMVLVCASVYGFPKDKSSFHGFHMSLSVSVRYLIVDQAAFQLRFLNTAHFPTLRP